MRRHRRFETCRRKLAAACAAYLAGVWLTGVFCAPMTVILVLCALFSGLGLLCRARRRSAFFCVLALMLLIGHGRAAWVLSIRDAATEPGVTLTGTVVRKLSDTRVCLADVTVDGETRLSRRAVVTLMLEEGEGARTVSVGQAVSGTGRLFEQEGVRNPGGMDGRIAALCGGYELSGYLLPGWSTAGKGRFSVIEAFRLAREALCARAEQLFGDQAGLFQAVMLGSRMQLDADTVQAMRLSGIAHVLTVSGMHLSLMAYAMRRLLRRLRIGRRGRFAAQTVLLGLFCLLTGGAPGTVRAYLMTLIRELAPLTGRRYDPLNALAAAALMMAAANPLLPRSASFQFSFFVVLGILLLSRQIASALTGEKRRRGRSVLHSLSLSLSAQIAALPMQLMLYGYVPLLALPMNVICGALLPVLLLGGWGTMLVSAASPGLGCALGALVNWPARLLERLSLAASCCAWGLLRLPAPLGVTVLLDALLMAVCSRRVRVSGRRARKAFFLAALMACTYLPRFDGSVRYVQLDVGQGDGALLRSGRHALIVDVGPEDSYAMLRYLRHEGLHVDAVVLSHLDVDHAGALATLLASEVAVPRLVMAVGAQEGEIAPAVSQALDLARGEGVRIEWVRAGDAIEAAGFTLDVLSPDDALSGSNERSLVLTGEVGGMTLLTLGDLPADCEMEAIPDCDILKVSHHGSKYATSTALIGAASPQVALISVGRNSYGHPSERVLGDLAAVGAQVLRTDQCGCITVRAGEDGPRALTLLRGNDDGT